MISQVSADEGPPMTLGATPASAAVQPRDLDEVDGERDQLGHARNAHRPAQPCAEGPPERVQERLTALLTHRQAGSVPSAGSPSFTAPRWRRWFGR
jgi:hypothetical protein